MRTDRRVRGIESSLGRLARIMSEDEPAPARPIHRAVRCRCGYASCTDWHVEPVAAVQSVGFTEAQARLVARLLNAPDEVEMLKALAHPLSEALSDRDRLDNFCRTVHALFTDKR